MPLYTVSPKPRVYSYTRTIASLGRVPPSKGNEHRVSWPELRFTCAVHLERLLEIGTTSLDDSRWDITSTPRPEHGLIDTFALPSHSYRLSRLKDCARANGYSGRIGMHTVFDRFE